MKKQYQVVDAQGNINRFNGPWATQLEAQAHIDWLVGVRLDRMRVDATDEEMEEKAAGRMTTNWNRYHLREAEARLPYRIIVREVNEWLVEQQTEPE